MLSFPRSLLGVVSNLVFSPPVDSVFEASTPRPQAAVVALWVCPRRNNVWVLCE